MLPLQREINAWLLDRRLPGGAVVKNIPANAGDARDSGSNDSWVGKIPWNRKSQPAPYSCLENSLENSMDTGTWWAIVHRVTQSRVRLDSNREGREFFLSLLFLSLPSVQIKPYGKVAFFVWHI